MRRRWVAALVAAVGAAVTLAAQGTKTGSPEQNLPSNITQLTAFGERASWSPDGRRIAFMSKSFGDAFVVDVSTKMVRLLTHYQNPGFLRVQYLPNGDFFLIGARTFSDIRTTRSRDQEMWVLRADGEGQPIPLDHKISEGVAISRKSAKIAWSNTHGQYRIFFRTGNRLSKRRTSLTKVASQRSSTRRRSSAPGRRSARWRRRTLGGMTTSSSTRVTGRPSPTCSGST